MFTNNLGHLTKAYIFDFSNLVLLCIVLVEVLRCICLILLQARNLYMC
jgi:hypothetical protein